MRTKNFVLVPWNTLRTWLKCEVDIKNDLTGMGFEGLD